MNIAISTSQGPTKYTIEHRGACIFIDGSVPMAAFGTLMMLAPKSSVMDPDVARIYGVNFAVGPAKELEALRLAGVPAQEARMRQAHPDLSADCHRWLSGGERGGSSDTIFQTLTGRNALDGRDGNHPYDMADFRRCQLLLEQVPELIPVFFRMKDVSAEWARLVDAWPYIREEMAAECPSWREDGTWKNTSNAFAILQTAIGR